MPETEEVKEIKSVEDLANYIDEGNEKLITDKILPVIDEKFTELNAKVDSKLTPFADVVNESQPKFDSLGEQLLAVKDYYASQGASKDKRLQFETKHGEPSGLHEGTPSEGGFLVQTDFVSGLITPVHDASVLYNKCWKIPVGPGKNAVNIKLVRETSRADGSRWGGVRAYFADEADTVTASRPAFKQFEVKLGKLMGIMYATDEMLEDAVQLTGVAKKAFTEEFAFKLDDGIFRGTGTTQPFGIINSGSCIEQACVTGQASNSVVAENIEQMYQRMLPRSLLKAEWYIHSEVQLHLWDMYKAAGNTGYLMYMPPGGLSQAPYGTLMGRPVNIIEHASAPGTLGDIVFADFSQYVVIEKGGMKADNSIHVRFLYGENTFRFTLRINGAPISDEALTPYTGSNTLSYAVALSATGR